MEASADGTLHPRGIGPLRRAWYYIDRKMFPLFFSANYAQSGDFLVKLVVLDPAAASWFIQCATVLSAIQSLLVVATCAAFLLVYWPSCAECSRPLRWWLLVQAAMQCGQLPVRVVFLLCLRFVERAGGNVMALVNSFTLAPAWRSCKLLGMCQYAWLVLGAYWWMDVRGCPQCPGIGGATAGVIAMSAARAAATMALFLFVFPDGFRGLGRARGPASPALIAAVGTVNFSAGSAGANTSCSICLADFRDGDVMRRLPCGHDFHRSCVDQWLWRNKSCPLCAHPVDEPCRTAFASKNV